MNQSKTPTNQLKAHHWRSKCSKFINQCIDSLYDWMIRRLHHRIMYKHVFIDSQHKIWIPRWGHSKRQIQEANKRAEELAARFRWSTVTDKPITGNYSVKTKTKNG
jgi:hypothetical protein